MDHVCIHAYTHSVLPESGDSVSALQMVVRLALALGVATMFNAKASGLPGAFLG